MLVGKVFKGISWQLSGRVLGNLIGFVSTLIVAYLISPDDFGVFALAFSVVRLATAMLDFQTGMILIRMPDPKREDFDTVFTVNLLRGLALSLILILVAWPYAMAFGDPRLLPLLLVLGLYPIATSLQNPYFMLHAKALRFLPSTAQELALKLATMAGSVGFALVYASYWALVAGLMASAVISTLFTYMMSAQRPGLSLKSWRAVLGFSAWLALATAASVGASQFQRLLIGGVFGTALLGAFALAAQIVEQIIQAILHPFNYAVYSALSQISDDLHRLRASFLLSQAAYCAVVMPVAAGLALVADGLINVFLQDKWQMAVLLAQFVAAEFVISAIIGPFWSLAMALGRTRALFHRAAMALVIQITAQTAGLLYAGLIGFLVAGLIAALINAVIALALVKSLSGIAVVRLAFNVVRPMLATLIMAGAVLGVDQTALVEAAPVMALFVKVAVGAITYGLASLGIWGAMGRPRGPESVALDQAGRVLRGLSMSRAT